MLLRWPSVVALLQQHFTYRLVLELDEVQVLNSDLIGQLMQLYRRIEEHDGVMRLCGLSPHNRQVLHACHLDDRLLPYEDRQEAVMGRPHRPDHGRAGRYECGTSARDPLERLHRLCPS